MNLDLLIGSAQPLIAAGVAQPRYRTLERLLARGETCSPPPRSIELALLDLFGFHTGHAVPRAALTLLGDGGQPGSDYWLRIDPVCLQPTRTQLVLAPLPPNDLTPAETRELTTALTTHLLAAGYDIAIPHPQRWYVRCRVPLEMQTVCPSLCAGVLSEEHLPAGRDSAPWRRLITEVQMLLHDAPVNVAREAAGKRPVNAIWPWGGGHLPRIDHAPYACVLAANPLAIGLARATQAQARVVPRTAIEALASNLPNGSNLIVLDEYTQAADASLRDLEDNWFAPLAAALGAGTVEQLRILLCSADRTLGRVLTRTHLRRWWRRSRLLGTYA